MKSKKNKKNKNYSKKGSGQNSNHDLEILPPNLIPNAEESRLNILEEKVRHIETFLTRKYGVENLADLNDPSILDMFGKLPGETSLDYH